MRSISGNHSQTTACLPRNIILSGELEDWLHVRLAPRPLVWEYPTIEKLARHLSGTPDTSESDRICETDRGKGQEPIAIVGLGCRFPGAADPESFWRLLESGTDAITVESRDRSGSHALSGADSRSRLSGGFLQNVDQFDPQFFAIAPREAVRMDPTAASAVGGGLGGPGECGNGARQAGWSSHGIFVGISTNDYGRLQFSDPGNLDAYSATGNAFSIAANRLSYFLNLKGPSLGNRHGLFLFIGCRSPGLESLRLGECKMALAGGVNLILSPDLTLAFSGRR